MLWDPGGVEEVDGDDELRMEEEGVECGVCDREIFGRGEEAIKG